MIMKITHIATLYEEYAESNMCQIKKDIQLKGERRETVLEICYIITK